MKRRSFIAGIAGTAVGALAPSGRAGAEAGPLASMLDARAGLVRAGPMVWAPRADGAEIVLAVSRLARGRVEVRGPDGALVRASGDGHGFVPQSAGVLKVRLEGLTPGARYEWRALIDAIDGETEQVVTPWKSLRTLDPAAASTHFTVWNDTHENVETIQALQRATPSSDFLLWNGDTCNDWHEEDSLVPILLGPGGIDISEGHPLLLTLGNHDVRGKFAFRLPDHVAQPQRRPYYAFRSGPVAVIALHTGEDKPDDHPSFQGRVDTQALRVEQREWLRTTLAQPGFVDAPYRLVFCHIPLRWLDEPETVDYAGVGFDRYARSSRDLWHDLLVDWGAQVIISGHTHRPAYLPPAPGFPYAQFTGGGPRPDQATWIEGRADGAALSLTMRRLEDASVIHQERFPRLT